MKLTNKALLFFVIAFSFFIVIDVKENNMSKLSFANITYNKILDNAVDDGVYNLVEVDKNKEFKINKEEAIIQFYQSLSSNLGTLSNSMANSLLEIYIPIVLIVDMDGFYINYHNVYYSDNNKYINNTWTEKIPYVYEDDNYIYKFSLDTYIKVIDKNTYTVLEGYYEDLKDSIGSIDNYEEIKRKTIIEVITENMNYYINNHNYIAQQFGIQYNFEIPQIKEDDWSRTIEDITMMVIFQGYPYGVKEYVYNNYFIGGARIKKSKIYYISNTGNMKYYHKGNCDHVINEELVFYTPEEAAEYGAFPCMDCIY